MMAKCRRRCTEGTEWMGKRRHEGGGVDDGRGRAVNDVRGMDAT